MDGATLEQGKRQQTAEWTREWSEQSLLTVIEQQTHPSTSPRPTDADAGEHK